MPEHIIDWLINYQYLIVLPVAVLEGPVLALICGFLLKMGYFSFWPIFLLLMFGDIVSDIYWYCIGYYGGRRLVLKFGKYFSLTNENLAVAEKVYHRHYIPILFLSKITMGFGFAIAIVAVAGITKLPFRKYMLVNIIAQPIWTATLLAAGFWPQATTSGIFIPSSAKASSWFS
jgi:membrane-associated protein